MALEHQEPIAFAGAVRSGSLEAGSMSKRGTVIGLICSLALVGGGIALSVVTASSMGIMLVIPGFLSVILVSVFATIGVEPQPRRRAK